jgi:hypothetical protein
MRGGRSRISASLNPGYTGASLGGLSTRSGSRSGPPPARKGAPTSQADEAKAAANFFCRGPTGAIENHATHGKYRGGRP